MNIAGIVERIRPGGVSGWVRGIGSDVEIRAYANGVCVGSGGITKPRADASRDGLEAFGYLIELSNDVDIDSAAIEVRCSSGGGQCVLPLWRPLDLARKLNLLSDSDLRALRQSLLSRSLGVLADHPSMMDWRVSSREKMAVVCYANDSSGWFDFFYEYYSGLVGGHRIYVVTPQPSSFAKYETGGVLSIGGAPYLDTAISRFMSHISGALLAYYENVLVSDVDELLFPHPEHQGDFFDLLDAIDGDVVAARGLDVVQAVNESEFDFSKKIWKQRSLAVPNSAISKPYIVRRPIRFSSGKHYCSHVASLPRVGFLALHMKWACAKVRGDVLRVVNRTVYEDGSIAAYSRASVEDAFHPWVTQPERQVLGLTSEKWLQFDEEYYSSMKFHAETGFYKADYAKASYFTSLSGFDRD